MDADCQKIIQIIGRMCHWDKNVPVIGDDRFELALKSAGISENLTHLCIEELIKNRYILRDSNKYILTDKGHDYGYKKRLE
ncbi:MAG: hypothetical protein ACR2NW_07455 [Thermodesulfobacteriota bacterium]